MGAPPDHALRPFQSVGGADHAGSGPRGDQTKHAALVAPAGQGLVLSVRAEDAPLRVVVDLADHPLRRGLARVEAAHVDIVGARVVDVARAADLEAHQVADGPASKEVPRTL